MRKSIAVLLVASGLSVPLSACSSGGSESAGGTPAGHDRSASTRSSPSTPLNSKPTDGTEPQPRSVRSRTVTEPGSKSPAPEGGHTRSKSTTPSRTAKASNPDQTAGNVPKSKKPGRYGPDGAIPGKCDIKRDQVNLLVRDWSRVVDSVGRDDHGQYTKAFGRDLTALTEHQQSCPGGKDLEELKSLSKTINAQVAADKIDYGSYQNAVDVGNRWLKALGFNSTRLTSG